MLDVGNCFFDVDLNTFELSRKNVKMLTTHIFLVWSIDEIVHLSLFAMYCNFVDVQFVSKAHA